MESLRSGLLNKNDGIPYFDIRYSAVRYSIKVAPASSRGYYTPGFGGGR
jgi:hypothetical protein